MKADLHAHTVHSGTSTLPLLKHMLRESYNTPERVYGLAKARGMDLVAITDHDQIGHSLPSTRPTAKPPRGARPARPAFTVVSAAFTLHDGADPSITFGQGVHEPRHK